MAASPGLQPQISCEIEISDPDLEHVRHSRRTKCLNGSVRLDRPGRPAKAASSEAFYKGPAWINWIVLEDRYELVIQAVAARSQSAASGKAFA